MFKNIKALMSFNTQKYGAMTREHRRSKGVRMKKRFKKVVFENEYFIFIINEKDNALFENATKRDLDDVYFLIEILEFLQVDFEILKWGVRK